MSSTTLSTESAHDIVLQLKSNTSGASGYVDIVNLTDGNRFSAGVDGTSFSGISNRVLLTSWNNIPLDLCAYATNSTDYILRVNTSGDISLQLGSITTSTSGYYYLGSALYGMNRSGDDVYVKSNSDVYLKSTTGVVNIEPLAVTNITASANSVCQVAARAPTSGYGSFLDVKNTGDSNRLVMGVDGINYTGTSNRVYIASWNNIPVDIGVYGSSDSAYIMRLDTDGVVKLKTGLLVDSASGSLSIGSTAFGIEKSGSNINVKSASDIQLTSAGGVIDITMPNTTNITSQANNACAAAVRSITSGYGAFLDVKNTADNNRLVAGIDGLNYAGGSNRVYISSWNNIPMDFGVFGSNSTSYVMRLNTSLSMNVALGVTADSSSGFYYIGSSSYGMVRSSNNTQIKAASGEVQLLTTTSGNIRASPAGTSSFVVSTNGGAYDAFAISSIGFNNADSNTISYAGVMTPTNGGRFIAPNGSLPVSPANGELFYQDVGSSVFAPRFYDGGGWKYFTTSINSYQPMHTLSNTPSLHATRTYNIRLLHNGTVFAINSAQGFGVSSLSVASNNPLSVNLQLSPTLIACYYAHATISYSNVLGAGFQCRFSAPIVGISTSATILIFNGDGTALNDSAFAATDQLELSVVFIT